MEEVAINIAEDKEKRQKPINNWPNIWYSICKGQGHLIIEYSSSLQMIMHCTYYGGKHSIINCWNLQKQQQIDNQIII